MISKIQKKTEGDGYTCMMSTDTFWQKMQIVGGKFDNVAQKRDILGCKIGQNMRGAGCALHYSSSALRGGWPFFGTTFYLGAFASF